MGWSKFDLLAYESRLRSNKDRLEVLDACENEAELHQQILDECRRMGWMVFHGSMAHRTFRVPGEPDLLIFRDSGRLLMVECKTRTGKLSTDQQTIHTWALKLGHQIHTVRSIEEFHQIANQTTTKQNE